MIVAATVPPTHPPRGSLLLGLRGNEVFVRVIRFRQCVSGTHGAAVRTAAVRLVRSIRSPSRPAMVVLLTVQ